MPVSELLRIFSDKLSIKLDAEAILLSGDCTIVNFLFKPGESDPFAVAKISAIPNYNHSLELEHRNMVTVSTVFTDAAASFVPMSLGEGEWNNHYYYIQEYIKGSMLNSITELDHLWWKDSYKLSQINKMCEMLLEIQVKTHTRTTEISKLHFHEDLADYRQVFKCDKSEESIILQLEANLIKCQDTIIPLVACHGDFYAGNLLLTRNGFRVLDWGYYLAEYHPFFDITTMCFSFLGKFEDNSWKPLWEKTTVSSELLATVDLMLEKVSRRWMIKKKVVRLLVLMSCVSLAMRGFRNSGSIRTRDEGWRKMLLWLGAGNFFNQSNI